MNRVLPLGESSIETMRGRLRSALSTLRLLALGAGAALTLMACGPDYERIDINGQTQSDLGGVVNARQISIPEGMAVKVHIVPWNDDDEMMQGHAVSDNDSILEVRNVVSDRDFVFIARKVGQTSVAFQADGKTVLIVDATVTPQATP